MYNDLSPLHGVVAVPYSMLPATQEHSSYLADETA